ncbi:hypothetical protein KDA14_01625 [Candidatus Saccharibacteria bacterium]|nr:hypothetical protein [Candidatus Saccharibacteria bacterium]
MIFTHEGIDPTQMYKGHNPEIIGGMAIGAPNVDGVLNKLRIQTVVDAMVWADQSREHLDEFAARTTPLLGAESSPRPVTLLWTSRHSLVHIPGNEASEHDYEVRPNPARIGISRKGLNKLGLPSFQLEVGQGFSRLREIRTNHPDAEDDGMGGDVAAVVYPKDVLSWITSANKQVKSISTSESRESRNKYAEYLNLVKVLMRFSYRAEDQNLRYRASS